MKRLSMETFDRKRAEKIVAHMMEKDEFSRWMEVEVLEVDEGYCKVTCPIKKEMLNGFSVTHGGIVFSLADSALAFSAATYGRVSLAIENSISFTRKTVLGNRITAESRCINLTHKTGLFEVKILDQDNNLVALMKATVYRTSDEFPV
ncbi:hotdog fold thioesterase [Rhodohalobacter sp.]|uniref:PaaI family thioesterase n=1 Tax=Rhodohalobacter sp. TaxID=1974210 RepID=UPI002ACEDF7F|nr:hotdog fold thioesterase [Rhodohalobacter sp.]MDZ7756879.1 hotdog fold thioesterase [Rhodohalobacter sp.]